MTGRVTTAGSASRVDLTISGSPGSSPGALNRGAGDPHRLRPHRRRGACPGPGGQFSHQQRDSGQGLSRRTQFHAALRYWGGPGGPGGAPGVHARKNALSKTCEYRASSTGPAVRPCTIVTAGGWLIELDLEAMAAVRGAGSAGRARFSAFWARAWAAATGYPVRRIFAAGWQTHPGGWLRFTITGSGFLRGMVRSLVGTMVEVGKGKADPALLMELLRTGERRRAGPTAPGSGAVSGGGGILKVFNFQFPKIRRAGKRSASRLR